MNSDEVLGIIFGVVGFVCLRSAYLHNFIAGNGDDISFIPLIIGIVLWWVSGAFIGKENKN